MRVVISNPKPKMAGVTDQGKILRRISAEISNWENWWSQKRTMFGPGKFLRCKIPVTDAVKLRAQ